MPSAAPRRRPADDPPLDTYVAVADVLIDRLELGLSAALPGLPPDGVDGFVRRLARLGVVAPRRRGAGGSRRLGLRFAVPGLVHGGSMTLGGELVLAAGAAGVTVTPASVIRPDAMRALRSQVVGPVPGLARRGEDNLVWEHGPEWRHLLGVQLDDVRRGVDALLAAIAAAAGCRRLAAGVWVRQCEVCRDHGVTDAAARVRAAARVPLAAAGGQLERVYSAAGGAGRGGPVASWDFGPARGRLVLKAYPKRDGIARVELAARSRGAVLALVGGRRAPPASDGEGLVRELEAVAVAAAPFLDAGRAQLDAALVPQAEAIELHAALWPLLRLIAPPARAAGAPGRSPSSAVADCARLALLGLLGDGRWDAGGLGTRDKVLVALVEMSGDGGALEAGPARSRAFALRPRYAAAGLALYAALLPGGGAAAQDG